MASDAAIAACPHCGREHEETVLRCPETDLMLPLPGRLLEGKFRLIEQLGRGGMATVWLARHTLVDRNVAIKIIRPEVVRNEQIIARFRGEAKAAGRIAHRNVCEILDFGIGPLGPYIVMERLVGQNLGQVLARWERLTAAQTVAILAPALEGLIAAHRRGIIHRDLKPENVFLHRNNEGRTVVKLMDFGVAKFTDGSGEVETEQGALLGTPQYMAPEQFKGADLADERTDVWGMGTILYRALGGRDAFRGPTVAATLMKVTHEEPEPLRQRRPELSERLEAVVLQCLHKAPADRFPNVEALKEALLAAAPPLLDLDDFAWDEEPPPAAAALPAMPGPPIVRRSDDVIPAPGLDLPPPIPPPAGTDPLLRALAEAQTVGIPAEGGPAGRPGAEAASGSSGALGRLVEGLASPSISTDSADRLDLPPGDSASGPRADAASGARGDSAATSYAGLSGTYPGAAGSHAGSAGRLAGSAPGGRSNAPGAYGGAAGARTAAQDPHGGAAGARSAAQDPHGGAAGARSAAQGSHGGAADARIAIPGSHGGAAGARPAAQGSHGGAAGARSAAQGPRGGAADARTATPGSHGGAAGAHPAAQGIAGLHADTAGSSHAELPGARARATAEPPADAPSGPLSPAEASLARGVGPARPAAPSRWSQRALVALVLGAVALGGLVWRARTSPETATTVPDLPTPPLDRDADADGNPMAGLPVPPPPDDAAARALPDAEPDIVVAPDVGALAVLEPEAFGVTDLAAADTDDAAADDPETPAIEPAGTTGTAALETRTDEPAADAGEDPTEPPPPAEPDVPPPPPAPEDPFGLIRAAEWVTPRELGPISDHNAARRYCESLGQANFAGYSGWQLANPGAATKLALTDALPNGRYWTSARWKGKVIVIAVPKARQSSRSAESRIARPLCAVKTTRPDP